MHIHLMHLKVVSAMLHGTTLQKAKSLLKPMLQSPVSHVLVSFVLGYYATTKIVKLCSAIFDNDVDVDNKNGDGSNDKCSKTNVNDKTEATPPSDSVPKLKLNAQQLMAYDGFNDKRPIYTALNGKIYDLSAARELFKPSGPYSLLAGCDANKVLAIACGYMNVSTMDFIQRWEQCLTADFNVIGCLISDDAVEETAAALDMYDTSVEIVKQ